MRTTLEIRYLSVHAVFELIEESQYLCRHQPERSRGSAASINVFACMQGPRFINLALCKFHSFECYQTTSERILLVMPSHIEHCSEPSVKRGTVNFSIINRSLQFSTSFQ